MMWVFGIAATTVFPVTRASKAPVEVNLKLFDISEFKKKIFMSHVVQQLMFTPCYQKQARYREGCDKNKGFFSS